MSDLEALQTIFREELDEPGLILDHGLSRDDLEGWDSLGHVRIIASVEQRFGFQFTLAEIEEANSVAALLDAIAARRG